MFQFCHAHSPPLVYVACAYLDPMKRGNTIVVHVLVQWQGIPLALVTWEPLPTLETRYLVVRDWGLFEGWKGVLSPNGYTPSAHVNCAAI
jgi:hypothetical protein